MRWPTTRVGGRSSASPTCSRYRIPGTRWRFGLDAVAGLIPGVGDVASAAVSLWLLWSGYRLGASKWTLIRMMGHVGVDTVLGAVPLVGDVFDAAYKANLRNVALLRRDLGQMNSTQG